MRNVVPRSYSTLKSDLAARARELALLPALHMSGVPVERLQQSARRIEDLVYARTGTKLEGLAILDVGCGQQFHMAQYFSYHENNVTGIDYNVVPTNLKSYLELLRTNGLLRVIKTIGRKAIGIDAEFSRNLQRLYPGRTPAPITILQMDAERMSLPDNSFDFVFSRSVFEHLENPDRVIREVSRVLKPGGVAHLGVHLYTCDGGAHDPRIFSGHRDDLPLWSHLRAAHSHKVRPNSYLNRLRLSSWKEMFSLHLPGVYIHLHQGAREHLLEDARALRASELSEYSEDELLTDEVVAIWRKPT
jgi:ubiquinone/menaquinone biosynthesis C-methylase UbiE